MTGKPYYTGQQASAGGTAAVGDLRCRLVDVPEQVRHELWLRAKATDRAGPPRLPPNWPHTDHLPLVRGGVLKRLRR